MTQAESPNPTRFAAQQLRDAAQVLFAARQRNKKPKCLYCGGEGHITTRYHAGIGGGYWLCRWQSCRDKDAATRQAFQMEEANA